jgi:hypothetical protein
MNEEEIKTKFVLPALAAKGILPSELVLEQTFSIRVGRQEVEIGSEAKGARVAGARLDILVKRAGQNLLVVETKSEDSKFTDRDRDQAVSYARLVHPIAPYAVVTNGREWRIFNSISKDEVDLENINLNGFNLSLPEESMDEALGFFLSCSRENLSGFCGGQVREQMRPLLGSRSDLSRKFIPELHVERQDFRRQVANFYRGNKAGFAVLGESGLGKTCSLCHLTLSLLGQGRPAMFFTGIALEGGILDSIASEFSWVFVDQCSPIQVYKRLERLRLGKPLTVVVDAIDEWSYPTKVQNLLSILRRADPRVLRFVFSCKTEAWPAFQRQLGSSTGIDAYLYSAPKSGEGTDELCRLTSFEEGEFHEALTKYREVFGVHGGFEDQVLKEAQRNPFLLRILFHVSSTTGLQHITFSATKVFEEYHRLLLEKMPNPEISARTLHEVAKQLFRRNTDWIDEAELRGSLGLPLNERLDPALFEHNVLVRRGLGTATQVGFNFTQFRDFVISFCAMRWPELDEAEFRKTAQSIGSPGVQLEAVVFYYRHAPEGHRRVLDKPAYDAARCYLDFYGTVLNAHFRRLMPRFRGCARGHTGFYGELNIAESRLAFYGFRDLGLNDPEIYFHPTDSGRNPMVSHLFGVDRVHWVGDLLRGGESLKHTMLRGEVAQRLEEIVENGELIEDNASDLTRELLLAAIDYGERGYRESFLVRRVLGRFWNAERREPTYPIKLHEVGEAIVEAEYFQHFEWELHEARREENKRRGRPRNVIEYTNADATWLTNRVREAVQRRETIKQSVRFVGFEKLQRWLQSVLRSLGGSTTAIEGPVLSVPEGRLRSLDEAEWLRQVGCYVRDLWAAFLRNYKCLVEVNFPTLTKSFALYSRTPLRAFLSVERDILPGSWDPLNGVGVTIAYEEGDFVDDQLMLCDQIVARSGDGRNLVVTADGQEVRCRYLERTTLHALASDGGHVFNPLNLSGVKTPLRYMVYNRIRLELPEVLSELLRLYGFENRA